MNKKEALAESKTAGNSPDVDIMVKAAEAILTETLQAEKEKNIALRNTLKESQRQLQLQQKNKMRKHLDEKVKKDVAIFGKFMNDVLAKEIKELKEEREADSKGVATERVKLLRQNMQQSKLFENQVKVMQKLMVDTLHTEVKELHSDRKKNNQILESRLNTLQKMQREVLATELAEFKQERETLTDILHEGIKQQQREIIKKDKIMEGNLATVQKVQREVLSTELAEFKQERDHMFETVGKLENLLVRQLTEELSEFQEDKRLLSEQKIQLAVDAKRKIKAFKEEFVTKSSSAASKVVNETLHNELSSLRQGIKEARENTFGRKLFEAFVGEFTTSVFNENNTARKLMKKLSDADKNVSKLQKIVSEQQVTLNKSDRALNEAIETSKREVTVGKLVSSLSGVQKRMMVNLLENVSTSKLEKEFNRYLPQVLERNIESRKVVIGGDAVIKTQLTESTGKRTQHVAVTARPKQGNNVEDDFNDINEILVNAGINIKQS